MKTAARRSISAALLVLAAFDLSAAPLARPEVGRQTAELCVATLPKPPSCGPAQVDLRADGTMRLRVDDVVYSMKLHSSQVEIVVMHNVVQIDEFTAPYEWVGNTLQFKDGDRNSRYEIRFTDRKR
ncbi:MAG: hypothetical protein V4569_00550 [Pseudomonadota bacterium]